MRPTACFNQISNWKETWMSQGKSGFDFSEPQRLGSALLTSALFGPGTEAMLAAQRAFVTQTETVLSGWMSRRQEAMQDMQQLIARLRDCHDMSEAMQAQQAWIGNEMRRLTEDAACCQQALLTGGMAVTAAAQRPNAANDAAPLHPPTAMRPKPSATHAGAA